MRFAGPTNSTTPISLSPQSILLAPNGVASGNDPAMAFNKHWMDSERKAVAAKETAARRAVETANRRGCGAASSGLERPARGAYADAVLVDDWYCYCDEALVFVGAQPAAPPTLPVCTARPLRRSPALSQPCHADDADRTRRIPPLQTAWAMRRTRGRAAAKRYLPTRHLLGFADAQ
jgi:hypothetical protein